MTITSLNKDEFFTNFQQTSNVFLSKEHLDIHLDNNKNCIYLVNLKSNLGIFLGIHGEKARNPYAAPFGGILSKDNRTDWTTINEFILDLTAYLGSIGSNKSSNRCKNTDIVGPLAV